MLQEPISFNAKDGRQFVIRSPKVEEAQMSLDMIIEVAASSPYILSTPESFRKKTIEDQVKRFSEYASSDTGIILAVYHQDQMIGICDGQCYKDIKRKHRAALGISLLPEFRGCGVGRKFMEVLLENMKKFSGVRIIELDVMLNNLPALRLYEQLGFRKGGVFPKAFVLPSGEVSDNLTMYLEV